MNNSFGLLLISCLFLIFPTQARADDAKGAEGLRGLEVMVRPAFGGAPGDSPVRFEPSPNVRVTVDPGALLQGASPYGAGFIGQGFIGYRFLPIISGGLRAGLRTTSASALADGSTDLSRSSWDAGFYVRAYPLAMSESVRKHLDPWIAVGVEYMRDTQAFKRPVPVAGGGTVVADWTLDHHAVAVPIGLGVDYRFHPAFSMGPSFEYAIASGVTGCAKQSAAGYSTNNFCSNEDPGKQFIKANTYGVWSVGLDLKVTLF